MIHNKYNLKKNKHYKIKSYKFKPRHITIIMIIIYVFSLILMVNLFNTNCIQGEISFYIPNPPIGPEFGYINIDYEYIIHTTDEGSYWMFDWGDGTISKWILVNESVTSVSKPHSWNSTGIFEVRVKHKNILSGESQWSTPLIIKIDSDLDNDGWTDQIEISYGTNYNDSSKYPLDTDGDRTPDNNSYDGAYIGDLDDDNDGLYDITEFNLGSNPKVPYDVIKINIDNNLHYLVDTDSDGIANLFYNSISKSYSDLDILENDIFLIDFNSDSTWDYSYSSADGMINVQEEWTFFGIPIYLLLIGIIAAIIISIIILFKTGIFYIYEVEVGEE